MTKVLPELIAVFVHTGFLLPAGSGGSVLHTLCTLRKAAIMKKRVFSPWWLDSAVNFYRSIRSSNKGSTTAFTPSFAGLRSL